MINNAEDGMYIQVPIDNSYDKFITLQSAETAFSDFAKLISFISGKDDKSIKIETGLPLRHSFNHEMMYVNTTSYQITDTQGQMEAGNVTNRCLEKIPINNQFFCEHNQFKNLWSIYERKHKREKLKDIESRILNASLAIGESAMSENTKNSVIYTCIALEILFSYDEGSLFQKSIGDKLADTFSFIVAKDKETRLETASILKKVYKMRSALVHGGEKEITNEYILINHLLRAAISELINNRKYSHLNKLDDLYAMVKEAQYSY